MKKCYFAVLFLSFFVSKSWAQTFLRSFTSATSFVKLNNSFYFAGGNDATGIELWKSDGTAEGTSLVKDIFPGPTGSNVQNLIEYKGKIYFAATDLVNGTELWVSDGTADGTKMLKDINPNRVGTGNPGSSPRHFTICNNVLYFIVSINSYNSAVWRTDGTTEGTEVVLGGINTGLRLLKTVGNKLYINGESYNGALYASDGTVAGTKKLTIDEYGQIELITVVNNELVFATKYSNGQKWRIYKLNPLNDTLTLIKSFEAATYGNIELDNITAVDNKFFFSIRTDNGSGVYTDALWKSDGTPAGTTALKSFQWSRHVSNSQMQNFVALNGKLYFAASGNYELWASDGTVDGTVQASTVKLEPSKTPLVIGSKIYFNTSTNQLWSYDGTTAKSELTSPSKPDQLFEFSNKVFFTIRKSNYKTELWNNLSGPVITVKNAYATVENKGIISVNAQANNFTKVIITIGNSGNKNLNLSEINVTGASFYVTGLIKRVIKPSESVTFNLIYSSGKEEVTNGTMIIKSDADITAFTVDLVGTTTGKATTPAAYTNDVLGKSITFNDDEPNFVINNSNINEKSAAGTLIGAFSIKNSTEPTVYTLADGNDGNFKIENGQLKSLRTFDYSVRSVYSIPVIATNASGVFQKNFSIQVNNIQEVQTGKCLTSVELLTYSLNDVAYTSSKIIAIGTSGKIITSDNDGKDWEIIPSGTTGSLNAIKMFEQVGYILGDQVLLKTENGGNSWVALNKPDNVYPVLTKMYFYSADIGYLFGEGKLYKTVDGGKSWKKQTAPNSSYAQNAMWMISENQGFMCGPNKSLVSTKNGGDSWEDLKLPDGLSYSARFNTLNFTSNTVGYVSDDSGNIYQTTDAGENWKKISNTATPSKIIFIDANTAYSVNIYGEFLYKTTDAGLTWVKENPALTSGTARALAIKPGNSQFCVVGWGSSYNNNTGHTIWLKSGTNDWVKRSGMSPYNTFFSTNWPDEKTGYVFGATSFKTTDGGITWKQMNIGNSTDYGIGTNFFISKDIGFCSYYGGFKKTVDGGETWTKLDFPTVNAATDLYFMDSKKGFASGIDGIYRTLDGGTTWVVVSKTSSISPPKLQFINQQVGFGTSIGSSFLKTTDGGATWSTVKIADISVVITAYFFDEQNGLLGGNDGQLYKTADGGATWTEIKTQMQQNIISFSFFDRNHGYAISTGYSNALIYETFDGGETWNSVTDTQADVRKLQLLGTSAYGAGGTGVVLKFKSIPDAPVISSISGDRIVAKGISATYTLPATAGISYNWTAPGVSSISYQPNTAQIIWNNPGVYQLKAKAQNNCAIGAEYSINITVQDTPEPKLTGKTEVLSFSKEVEYTTEFHTNSTYIWTITGSDHFTSNGNKVKVDWGNGGIGKVSVTEVFNDFNIMKNVSIDIKVNNLSNTNFNIAATSATCKGSNNGILKITAEANYNYLATVTGPGNFNNTYAFNTVKEIQNLIPGTYSVCITIEGNASSQKCFTINVSEPKDLSVYADVKTEQKILMLTLSGAKRYNIELNGVGYQTSDSNFELKLESAVNKLKVSSDLVCQGIFEKVISLDGISAYPNPVIDWLTVNLGISRSKNVSVKISDLSGRLIYNKTQSGEEGFLRINFSSFTTGMYVVQVITDNEKQTYKILKR